MFEDKITEDETTKYHVIRTPYTNCLMDMRESYVSGEHIAEGFEKALKGMDIPVSVKFQLQDNKGELENKWVFDLTIEGEKKEN